MSQEILTRCDICGKIKGESNRWFQVRISNAPCFMVALAGELDRNISKVEKVLDICGEKCLHTLISNKILEFTNGERSQKSQEQRSGEEIQKKTAYLGFKDNLD